MEITFAPRAIAPLAKACSKSGEESRMSWPTTTDLPASSSSSTKPAANASTTSSVRSMFTKPRTS